MIGRSKEFVLFFVAFVILLISFKSFSPSGTFIDTGLRKSESRITAFVLGLFFDDVESKSCSEPSNQPAEEIYFKGKRTLTVINECDAFSLHLMYSLFILAIGGAHSKVFSLLLGNIIIYFSNVLRLVSLTLVAYYNHDAFEFHHAYTFSLLLYLIVFVLWYFYLNEKSDVV